MLTLASPVRLACAGLLVLSALASHSLAGAAATYAAAVLAVLATGVARSHGRFLLTVGGPLLAALLILWGWLASGQRPAGYASGVAYAVASWLRIAACAAALQALITPLIGAPEALQRFLQDVRLPPPLTQVLVSALIFMPEVGRRLARLMDARAAQALPNGPVARTLAIPQLLAPLVACLLDTAARRAEFWEHRNVLAVRALPPARTWPVLPVIGALVLAGSAVAASLLL